jgi:hypothetical protein
MPPMLTRGTRRTVTRLALLALLVLPSAAHAAAPAVATISACGRDNIAVAGKVSLTGRSARKARGAVLQVRFQALPLFGLPHSADWKTVGKKTKASSQELFPGLPADNWVGVMSWRFKKGRKTVLSGLARSEALRVGRSKGRSSCTIAEGLKPVDKTPPALFILPSVDAWYHAPANVQLTASDDFSGVQSVRYGLDGGAKQPIKNGSTFQIPDQGDHTVDAEATDVAGNTGVLSAKVKVDGGPPSKPSLSRPFSVTQSATPQFTWSASTDSGSGMRGYVLTIRKASDNSIVAFQVVGADTTSIPSPASLTDGETYTATVTAVDNTADVPWTVDSDALTFRVDSNADATAFSPASGTILSGSANSTNFTISLDRVADKSTVTTDKVKLERSNGSQPTYAVNCNTPCTQITVDPSGSLPEGHYTLSLQGVTSSDEGLVFSGSAKYAVPFAEGDSIPQATSAPIACSDGTSLSPPYTGMTAPAGETAFLDFDITHSGPGGWTLEAFYGANAPIASISGQAGGHYRLNIPIGGNSGTLQFRLRAHCGSSSTQVSADNLFGSRYP